MKKMTPVILLPLVLLALTLTSVHGQTSRPWKIGHVRPAGSVTHGDVQQFVDSISRDTAGRLMMDIYAGSKLGDYSVVQERVSFGEVEMFVGPFGTAVDKRLALSFTPYLVQDWEQARKVYASSSPLLAHMRSFLAEQNIKILAGYPVYFGGMALTVKPKGALDPEVKKKAIIRVPPMRSFELTARQLGYTPYPITWMYARMGLKTGMVEGMLGGGAEGYAGLPEVRYYLPVRDHFEYWYVYMNLELWNALDRKDQQVLLDAAAEMERRRYQQAEQLEQQSHADLSSRGVEILPVNAEVYEDFRKRIREKVWPVLEKEIGEPFREVVRFADSL